MINFNIDNKLSMFRKIVLLFKSILNICLLSLSIEILIINFKIDYILTIIRIGIYNNFCFCFEKINFKTLKLYLY